MAAALQACTWFCSVYMLCSRHRHQALASSSCCRLSTTWWVIQLSSASIAAMFSFWRYVYKYNAVSLTGRKSLSGAQWRSAAHPQTSGPGPLVAVNVAIRPAAPITLRALPGMLLRSLSEKLSLCCPPASPRVLVGYTANTCNNVAHLRAPIPQCAYKRRSLCFDPRGIEAPSNWVSSSLCRGPRYCQSKLTDEILCEGAVEQSRCSPMAPSSRSARCSIGFQRAESSSHPHLRRLARLKRSRGSITL